MEKIRKNFGFGCMRLPMIGEDVDMEQTKQMVDCFLEQGFNYFDTAHGYLQGKSELALKECLTSRYPREDYVLTDKLSGSYFKKEEDIRPFFESQLAACGVDYFDFYLVHAQSIDIFAKFKCCWAYETALDLKAEGKLRHFGISFHDRAQVLQGLPELQKTVIVMEPCKGGNLVKLPEDTKSVGYTNWWKCMPMAMFTFLERYDLAGKRILPFCTNEGSDRGSSKKDLRKLCVGATIEFGLSNRGSKATMSGSRGNARPKSLNPGV